VILGLDDRKPDAQGVLDVPALKAGLIPVVVAELSGGASWAGFHVVTSLFDIQKGGRVATPTPLVGFPSAEPILLCRRYADGLGFNSFGDHAEGLPAVGAGRTALGLAGAGQSCERVDLLRRGERLG